MISEGIYITLGAGQIKEHGYRKYLKDFSICNGETGFWYYKMKNLPVRDFVDVYLVIGNRVRWKARLLEIVKNVSVHYFGGEVDENFTGLVLIDFVKLPMPYEHKKGFQGFRYKN